MNSGAFVGALQTKDFASRKAVLEELRKEFDCSNIVPNHDDVKENSTNGDSSHNFDDSPADIEGPNSECYPVLLRLAHECPFKDVRFACEDILSKLETKGVRVPRRKSVGPSHFISSKDTVPVDTDDHEAQTLFQEAFLLNGRTSHVHQLLAYHIRYLSCFLKFESQLMNANGALPLQWRYYIGIMAASKHGCIYLVDECREMFLLVQGDPSWLEGIKHAPMKLRKLDTLTRLLAHQPWLINEKNVEELLISGSQAERWTVSELTHAVVIIAHYLTLSGLVFACGINPELDMSNGYSIRSPSTSSTGSEPLTPTKLRNSCALDSSVITHESGTTTAVYERIKRVQQEEDVQDGEEEEDVKIRQFKEMENKECDECESDITCIDTARERSCSMYNEDENFHYEEYKRNPDSNPVFRESDFNWQEHCFSFLNRSFPNMGFLMDEKFKCTSELTYRNVGDITNIDTTKFRVATWNFVHLLYVFYHEDYNYAEVEKLLDSPYKNYIKKVACYPERVSFVDFEFTNFLPSEKVHVNLLVLESRFQAIILYATRSIMNHMNQNSKYW